MAAVQVASGVASPLFRPAIEVQLWANLGPKPTWAFSGTDCIDQPVAASFSRWNTFGPAESKPLRKESRSAAQIGHLFACLPAAFPNCEKLGCDLFHWFCKVIPLATIAVYLMIYGLLRLKLQESPQVRTI